MRTMIRIQSEHRVVRHPSYKFSKADKALMIGGAIVLALFIGFLTGLVVGVDKGYDKGLKTVITD